jgi:uncharacterized membrane protein
MRAFIPSKLAEVIFALIIAYLGYWHFKNADAMGSQVPSYMPGPGSIWIYITGAAFILSAIGILTEIRKTLACYLLAAMLLTFVFTIHYKSFDLSPFNSMKDVALAMAAIIIGNSKK